MNSNSTSRMPMLAGVGLALAALLMLLPAPGHADTLNVTDDTYVKANQPGKNFGDKTSMKVRDGNTRDGYAIFDLSVLGTDEDDIDTATLRIWIRRVISAGTIDVCRVDTGDGPWSETVLTFAGTSGFTLFACKEVTIAAGDKGTWKLVDITDFVKGWLASDFPNHGIALIATGTSIQVDSKESQSTSHPLEIEATHEKSAGGGSLIGGRGKTKKSDSGDKIQIHPVFSEGRAKVADQDKVENIIPEEGEVTRLHVILKDDIDSGSGIQSVVFTLRKTQADTDVGGPTTNPCKITEFNDTCSDNVDTACYQEGDKIALKSEPNSTGIKTVSMDFNWMARFTPGSCD
ncbi:MAG: DNRLRE domain-containing protein [Nitrospinae bacterium]|nr:DNRLRE domain-containing protein [Nitrospinota bacterium]